jgi:hypothetical protein
MDFLNQDQLQAFLITDFNTVTPAVCSQGYADSVCFSLSHAFNKKGKVKLSRRSQWPRRLKHEPSSPARTLGSWVQTPLEAWMSVCVYSVFVLFCV